MYDGIEFPAKGGRLAVRGCAGSWSSVVFSKGLINRGQPNRSDSSKEYWVYSKHFK